ncbi:MAG: HD domain-containing protein [Clostridia bacterium]|nr:HD domain-containing protein [Clostridia bacterium]
MNQSKYPFGEAELTALRQRILSEMSPKRYHHTAAVEDMVVRLATLYCPEEIPALRAAALLHDITKEYDIPTQMALLTEAGQPPVKGEEFAHKTFHARTAALLIPDNYPAFNCETVVNAVRWHTTGREDMTLTEELLYLADYIDDSRLFPDCVRLRSFFWDAHPERMTMEDRLVHLRRTLIMSFDMTMRALLSEGAVISPDTALARNRLVLAELTESHR